MGQKREAGHKRVKGQVMQDFAQRGKNLGFYSEFSRELVENLG